MRSGSRFVGLVGLVVAVLARPASALPPAGGASALRPGGAGAADGERRDERDERPADERDERDERPAADGPVAPPPAVPAEAAPPSAPTAEPASARAVEDADLQALGINTSTGSTDDKLTVYGFATFDYFALRYSRALPYVRRSISSFSMGSLNLYVGKELSPRLRTLGEVKFTFLPNGDINADGTYTTAMATNASDFGRRAPWGGIHIERAYLELDVTDWLTLRAGRWLTPYGIWNVDHGSPAIISINRPYVIGEQFFPEHQTGLELLGRYFSRGFTLVYHATLSNGRGASEAQIDQDNSLAFGARLELETPWGLHAGASYYRGRYTGFPADTAMPEKPSLTYQEAGYAGDLQFERGALHVQAELIVRETHGDPGARPAAWGGGFVPDLRAFGAYVLAGYRLERWWSAMPFAFYEDYRPGDVQLTTRVWAVAAGVNLRPISSVVLKIQATRSEFDEGVGLFAGAKVHFLSAQASWVL